MKVGRLSTALLGALVAAILAQTQGVFATHQPADKVAATADLDDVAFVANANDVPLLSETFRTSKPTDLILQVSAECSIITDVATDGNDSQMAGGRLKFYMTIQTGTAAPILIGVTETATGTTTPGMAGDDGRVVFCNQKYQRDITKLGDSDADDARIRTFLETRQANAFNWVHLNAGNGVHTVRLFADYDEAETSPDATARGVVGRRTLVIEPVKAKNDEQVTEVTVD
jgi:hypothetical protein